MNFKNYQQYRIIKQKTQEKIKAKYGIENKSGIYIFYRVVAYIGKSAEKDGILGRCASHCILHKQHIDNSIHNRKLSCDNGQWRIKALCYCDPNQVDVMEKKFIDEYLKKGYELYNVESGGNIGKTDITKRSERKGYRDGVKQGYRNAQKEISKLFDKNLTYTHQGLLNKNKEKALEKFKQFINI